MGLLKLLFGKKEKPKRTVSYHKKFHLRGINYECKKDKDMKRQEILQTVWLDSKTKVHLERFIYKKSQHIWLYLIGMV